MDFSVFQHTIATESTQGYITLHQKHCKTRFGFQFWNTWESASMFLSYPEHIWITDIILTWHKPQNTIYLEEWTVWLMVTT